MEHRRAFVSTKALRRPQGHYLCPEDFEGYRSAEQPTRSEAEGNAQNKKLFSINRFYLRKN